MEEQEIWKSCGPLGFPNYSISGNGNIKNIKSGKSISHCAGVYPVVFLTSDNGKRRQITVHVLLAKLFLPNPDNKETVDHINRIKTDNRLCNLRWADRKEQTKNRTLPATTHGRRNIYQLSLDGEIIKLWTNVMDIERALGVKHTNIVGVCRGTNKTSYGFKWAYQEDIDKKLPHEWKEIIIDGNKTHYFGSSLGYVKAPTGRISQGTLLNNEYLSYSLNLNGKMKHYKTHALIANAFFGEKPKGLKVDHKDGNKLNNKANNLEYVTAKENNLRAVKLGLVKSALGQRRFENVIQLSLENRIICTYKSLEDVLENNKDYKVIGIRTALLNKDRLAYGFRWRCEKDYMEAPDEVIEKIMQIDSKTKKLIATYTSLNHIIDVNKTYKLATIMTMMKGKLKIAHGSLWLTEKDYKALPQST